MTTEELTQALEPSVASDKFVIEAAALTSIAISLKRIADMMDQSRVWTDMDSRSFHVVTEPRA
jgi:hypothetical protein